MSEPGPKSANEPLFLLFGVTPGRWTSGEIAGTGFGVGTKPPERVPLLAREERDLSFTTRANATVALGIFAAGYVLFGHFEDHKPKWMRLLEIALTTVLVVLISAFLGRAYSFALIGVLLPGGGASRLHGGGHGGGSALGLHGPLAGR